MAQPYTLSERIDDLNPEVWDGLSNQASWLLSRTYLKAMETALPANLTLRYALIREANGKPLVAMVMQIVSLRYQQTRPLDTDANAVALTETIGKIAPEQRILVCGNMLSFGQHGLAFAADADLKQAWHGVAEVLYRLRQAEKLQGPTHFMMIKDLPAPWDDAAGTLKHLSYRMLETEPNMMLELDPAWKNWDDYLNSLQSKYRSNVKNGILKPLELAACKLETLPDLASEAERIHALYKMVQSNADFRPFELDPAYFSALQAATGERLRASGLRRNGELLGFILTLADGDTAIAWHIGFDRTALEPKAALGAKPQTFKILLRHRQPVLNKMLKHVLLGVEHDDAPERNPFKKSPSQI